MTDQPRFTTEVFKTREEWLAARKGSIGGSDAASILGLSKYRSPFATWAHITGKIESDPPTLAMKAGLALEPLMRGELAEQGYSLDAPLAIVRDPEKPWAHYSPDALLVRPGALIVEDNEIEGIAELKKSVSSEDWDSEPHAAALAQVNWGLLLTGLPKAVIAALIGLGERMKVYDLLPEFELQAVMLERIEEFHQRYIVTDTPPPADFSESTRKALAALYPKDTGAEIELPAEEWRDELRFLRDAQSEIKRQKEIESEIENKLRAALGDASTAIIPGVGKVTWKLQKRKSYVVKESEFRVLRVTEEKA